jgi:hypothetical protein
VTNDVDLAQLDEHQLRELVRSMRTTIEADQAAIAYRDREIEFKQRLIDKITHEMAVLKRLKFAAQSERFTPEQRSLLEETIDADLAALDGELDKADSDGKKEREKQQPKRKPLPPPRVRWVPVLYLDYDGCLHPQDVWQARGGEPYVRQPPGRRVFEHADVLASLLAPYPAVRIVLSTTWARRFGFRGAADFLPAALRARCIGATWHQGMGPYLFDFMSRGEQVLDDVSRRRPARWLAIDDDDSGWGHWASTHLVLCHPTLGISEPLVLENIRGALKRFRTES